MIRLIASLIIRGGVALVALGLFSHWATAQNRASGNIEGIARKAFEARQPRFMENKGQWAPEARFYGGMPGLDYWVTPTGVVLDSYVYLPRPVNEDKGLDGIYREGQVVRMDFVGGGSNLLQGKNQTKEIADFYLADSPSFAKGVRSYGEVITKSIYPGIDVRNYYDNGRPRYDLVVAPGANANQATLRFSGANGISIDRRGDLVIKTDLGEIRQVGLKAFQNLANGQKSVPVKFVQVSSDSISIQVGAYDMSKPLVIDPLVYGTHFGGDPLPMQPGFDEMHRVYSGPDGGVYLTGSTRCATFPITQGFYSNVNIQGASDAFLTRMGGDIFQIQYSVFIGGTGLEVGYGIGMDTQGNNLWLGGTTTSTNLPGINGSSFMATKQGNTDVFLVHFNADPILFLIPDYSTYYGIAGGTAVMGITNLSVGGTTGNVYFAGTAPATGLPNMSNAYGGGATDAYLTIFDPTGTSILFSRYIGGNGGDPCTGFALDSQENSYVTGTCQFAGNQDTAVAPVPRFVTTPGVFTNGRLLRNGDTYILKSSPAGTMLYAALLGGSGNDGVTAVPLILSWPVTISARDLGDLAAVDNQGNLYVGSISQSFDYPRTQGVYGETFTAGRNTSLTKISADGSTIIYSTNIKSNGNVVPRGVGVDNRGVAYIGGMVGFDIAGPGVPTIPGNIPTAGNPLDQTYTGGDHTFGAPPGPGVWDSTVDGFITVLSANASELLYSSYIGDLGNDIVEGIYVDGSSSMYAFGTTAAVFDAVGAPQTPFGIPPAYLSVDAIKTQADASGDGFFVKMRIGLPTLQNCTVNPSQIAGGLGAFSTGTVTLVDPAPAGGVDVQVTLDNVAIATFVSGGSSSAITVNIPQGQTQAQFQVFSNPVGAPATTNVKASLDGDFKIAVLTVVPWLTQFTVQPASLVGGNPVQGRIVLAQPAVAGGVDVQLATNDAVHVLLPNPPTINVPAGVQTLTFPINTGGVTVNTAVNTTATLLGVSITANFNLLPAQLSSLTFNPPSVSNGSKSVATVSLDGKAGADTNVAIAYVSGLTGATFPASVTIPAQSSSVDFDVIPPFTPIDTSLTLSATLNAVVKQGTLNVLATDIVSIDLSSNNVLGGSVVTGTVTLSRPAGPGGFIVDLDNGDPVACTITTPNANQTVTVQPGQTVSDTFTIQTNPVPVDVDVTITAKKIGFAGFSQASTILHIRALTMTFVIDPVSVVGGVQPFPVATLTLSEAAPTDITVNLSTTIAPALNLPASMVIPAGTDQLIFDVPTVSVTQDYVGDVTADIGGGVTKTAPLTVRAPGIVSFVLVPPVVSGGNSSLGVVTLDNPAPIGGLIIQITSSSGAATVPATVQVPEGATGITFNIDTLPTPITTFATITVTRGITSAQAVLTITPPNLGKLKLIPNTIRGGQVSHATLFLDQNAPFGGITVNVSASLPGYVSMPSTVFIPAGQSTVTWDITAIPVSRKIGVEIICTVTGRPTRASAFLFIRP